MSRRTSSLMLGATMREKESHKAVRRTRALRHQCRASSFLDSLEPRVLLSAAFFVDASAPGPVHNGSSWATAYTNPQSALAVAVSGDQIHVAHGTYKPTTTTDRTISFQLVNGVSFLGGYAGFGAPNPDARDTSLYTSILSGDIGTVGSMADNTYHVVSAWGAYTTSIMDGFTIAAGNANGIPNYDKGGAILLMPIRLWDMQPGAYPTIRNCVFTGNSAKYGGAVYSFVDTPLNNCTFNANTALQGGALYYGLGTCAFTDDTFNNNVASNGGAVYVITGNPTFTNCTFSGNSASANGSGGAVYIQGSATLVDSSFFANSAGNGGAVAIANGSSTLVNCTMVANNATFGGAINNFASCTLTNSSLTANAAQIQGGAIANWSAFLKVTNSVLINNGSSSLYNNGANLPSVTFSDIQGGYAGTGNINTDPLFVRNPNLATGDLGDLRLQINSPCIDAGLNSASGLTAVTSDLAGAPRFVDIPATPNTGSAANPIDMGPYEAQPMFAFYAGSPAFDTSSDDAAIAPDKYPLLPGQSASFANYTSYSRGINGIMIDLTGLPRGLAVSDFSFKVGNDSNPAAWTDAPAPLFIAERLGDATGTWTRVEIIWPDNAIQNQWLQVTLKGGAAASSGLADDDVFYFGNAIGETGNSATDARVDALDELTARANLTASAAVTNPCDFDKNGAVDGNDRAIARTNVSWFLNQLQLITAPVGTARPASAVAAAPAGAMPAATADAAAPSPIVLAACAELTPAVAVGPVPLLMADLPTVPRISLTDRAGAKPVPAILTHLRKTPAAMISPSLSKTSVPMRITRRIGPARNPSSRNVPSTKADTADPSDLP